VPGGGFTSPGLRFISPGRRNAAGPFPLMTAAFLFFPLIRLLKITKARAMLNANSFNGFMINVCIKQKQRTAAR
jgi:hypothetical protein